MRSHVASYYWPSPELHGAWLFWPTGPDLCGYNTPQWLSSVPGTVARSSCGKAASYLSLAVQIRSGKQNTDLGNRTGLAPIKQTNTSSTKMIIWDGRLSLSLSNRLIASPALSPEDGNTSSFRNVLFLNVLRTPNGGQNPETK
jgi:hypothetical protein